MELFGNGYSSSSSDSCEYDELESWSTKRRSAIHKKHEHLDKPISEDKLMTRTVIHLDVDCFYCQCEEVMNPSLASRPFAVGQKHIIVTCNYIARDIGVKKLMLRSKAKIICPDLVIIEGSDLENYRRFSRKIYMTFRNAIKRLGVDKNGHECDIAVKKGGMDEMFADISHVIRQRLECKDSLSDMNKSNFPLNSFVFGNNNHSSSVSISEDQTGSKVEIIPKKFTSFTDMSLSNKQTPFADTNFRSREECIQRLQIGSFIANDIHEKIQTELGFTTCLGISVSPMLSKIASDLNKPNSVNILLPWRSWDIIKNMPLRRVPELGSRTLKKLTPCLEEYNDKDFTKDSHFWTCSDLLNVPHNTIVSVLAKCMGSGERVQQTSQLLLNRCKGIDPLNIVDDDGGLNKTVSVEDSFIRGSVTEVSKVRSNLETLVARLVRLLDERTINSDQKNLAYPTTIRLSVRLVDESIKARRPFSTYTCQKQFDGETFINLDSSLEKKKYLECKLDRLLINLLSQDKKGAITNLDLTKLNIAAINFKDLVDNDKRYYSKNSALGDFKRQRTVNKYFMRKDDDEECKTRLREKTLNEDDVSKHSSTESELLRYKVANRSVNHCLKKDMNISTINNMLPPESFLEDLDKTSSVSITSYKPLVHERVNHQKQNIPNEKKLMRDFTSPDILSPKNISDIDPNVLNALPSDIVSEILHHGVRLTPEKDRPTKKVKKGIEKYFTKTK